MYVILDAKCKFIISAQRYITRLLLPSMEKRLAIVNYSLVRSQIVTKLLLDLIPNEASNKRVDEFAK